MKGYWVALTSLLGLYRSATGLRFEGPWVDDLKNPPTRGQLFWGENNPYVDLTVAQRFAEERGYPLHVGPGAGHWACNERAAGFAGP